MLIFLFIILVPTTECGRERLSLEPFVIGGTYTTIKKFPHAVFLNMKSSQQWICGGSVVNQNIILTAAHCLHPCVNQRNTRSVNCDIYAFAGSSNVYTMKVLRMVARIKCHEHYDDVFVENDVALAMVNDSLPLGQGFRIRRVVLRNSFPHLTEFEVSGWGIIDETTRESAVRLKSVKQRILSRDVCETAALMHPGTMCAGSIVEDAAPTSGDSGSAVVTRDHQQIALVSYRSAVDDTPEPPEDEQENIYTYYNETLLPLLRQANESQHHVNFLFYTNVSYYYDWIKRHAIRLYCSDNL